MAQYLFPPAVPAALRVAGETALFPVRRVYCVGRNYRAHSREMIRRQAAQLDITDDKVDAPPFFFQKPAYGAVTDRRTVPYPPKTQRLEHELEMVVALGDGAAVIGCALGVDLTRRDLQDQAKAQRRPWDAAKAFDASAPCGALARGLPPKETRLELSVNGAVRQSCVLADMIYGVPEILDHLSREVELRPGDVIFTGTPEGVGPLAPGDAVACRAVNVDGGEALPACEFVVGEPRL